MTNSMSNKEQATSLNIAILPSPGVRDLAITLSQKVAQNFQTEFVLDEQKFMPHITVYQAHFPVNNIEKIKDVLDQIAHSTAPFGVTLGEFSISHDTFLFWNAQVSENLRRLHDQIVENNNHLREGLILPVLATVTGLTEDDKVDMQNYGSLLIGSRFRPHITITRLSDQKDEENVMKSLRKFNYKAIFEVNELILGYLGPNGTVNGIIETFKFGK